MPKMKRLYLARFVVLTVTGVLMAATMPLSVAQNVHDEIEIARSTLKADRKVVIAEGMQLTDAESQAFWPIYREYRASMDTINDGIVELVLEYADLYPDVPEDRAKTMLDQLAGLEKKRISQRERYMKRFRKVLPASKTLRFFQIENRLDLIVRLQIARCIPLVPTQEKKK